MFPKTFNLTIAVISLLVTPLFAAPFTDNSDGTVKDNATGLVWQKCSMGQNQDAACTGAASTVNWVGAVGYCTGLGLASKTWRLPNINELKTIVDTTQASGATINTTAFPATVAGSYWSSTTYAPATSSAWDVNFNNSYFNSSVKTLTNLVRCVSGP